ncbi:MAG TPA: TIGR03435 family protein [Acidobacteriaceae bacterium]
MRFSPHLFLFAATLAAAPTFAQTATPVQRMAKDAHPSFAVATIKPHDPSSNRQGFNAVGDRYTVRNQSIVTLMMFAYSIDPHQVVDAPEWARTARFDIEGTTDTPGEPSQRQQQEMLQKLLTDRFKLKFHREPRELPVYAIQIAKGGPKLPSPANPDADPDQDASGHGTEVTVTITTASMADFILGMQFFFDRPIVDRTGLTGRYDFKLRYTHDEARATDPNAPPGLFTAIQEQLGLKLEPVKAPIDVFAIEHVEQPSEN